MKASVLKKALLGAALASLASWVQATPITFSGSSGSLAASVSFDIVGGQLQVVLTNTSTADALVPVDILTAVFFDIASGSDPQLDPVSAISGGITYTGLASVSPAGTEVGGEWAYENGLSQYGANSGISSSGLGLFGAADVFPPGTNLAGPASPDGLQYGLTSAGDIQTTGNPAFLLVPLTNNSVTFLLEDLPAGFTLASITNVTFQYGTALSEGHFPGSSGGNPSNGPIPEPGTLSLVGAAILGGLFSYRRRRQSLA